jgi:chromosome segregation ATPase
VARAQEFEKRRERLAALEAEAKEARASAREAEVVAGRAQAEAERARRAVEALDKRLDEARRELRAFGS